MFMDIPNILLIYHDQRGHDVYFGMAAGSAHAEKSLVEHLIFALAPKKSHSGKLRIGTTPDGNRPRVISQKPGGITHEHLIS
jgi:hypothetical protein